MFKRNTSLVVKTALLWLFLCLAAGAPIVISAPDADVDLAITKTDSVDPAVAGEALTYRLSVSNTGPSSATGVAITDTLPGGLTYTSASGGCAYNAGSRTVRCNLGEVAVGAVTTATIQVRVDPSTTGSLLNQAIAATLDTDTNAANNTAQATTTITSSGDLRVSMSAPASVIAGAAITYTLAISNTGPSDASGVVLRDDFPGGTGYARSSLPCSVQGHRLTCTVGGVAANARRTETVTLLVDAGKTGTVSNDVQVSATTPDPNAANNAATLTTPVVISSDLTISKQGTPDPVAPGALLTYTITTRNNGLSNGQGVVISDTLPGQVAFQSYTATKGTCTGTHAITCTPGSVTPGEIITVTLVGRVSTAASTGTITNTVSVLSTSPDPIPTNNSASDRTTIIVEGANLQISKHDLIDPVRAGNALTYTISVRNNGPAIATGVIVTDTLPAAATLSSITTSQGTCTGTTCTLGTISATRGALITMTVTVDPMTTGLITNTASVSANEEDLIPENNIAHEATTILPGPADLQIAKHDLADPVRAGEALTYIITVSNTGPANATGVVVTDTLPASVTFQSATPSQGSCFAAVCALGSLLAGSGATITMTTSVDPAASGVITNSATVSASQLDLVLGNNSAHEQTRINRAADMGVVKTGAPEPAFAGKNLTYRLEINNHGPSRAEGVRVVDNLPSAVSFVSAPAGCTHTNGTVECILGGMQPSASVVISITVNVNLATTGPVSNIANLSSTTPDPVTGNNQSEWITRVLAPDYQAPTVSWLQPVLSGERINVGCQTLRLQVSATDNVAVQYVRFYRWDATVGGGSYVEIGIDTTLPYQWDIDTCKLAANWNQIFAEARDTYGNISPRKFIWIYRYVIFMPAISR
jgi:uncharacterized repeat protein (TIGR01451 family)